MLTAVLVGLGLPSTATGQWRAEPLPCRSGGQPPTTSPTRLPSQGARTCRAEPMATTRGPRPSPGYHHLGATTVDTWAGVVGRFAVTDPNVRKGTYDFVATRFLAKRSEQRTVHWLEAGWAETGWAGAGRQRVYTFDSVRDEWRFFDQYELTTRTRVWFHLEANTSQWRAWLWWGDAWHLLAAETLPGTGPPQIEQYVEVYVDPAESGGIELPPTDVDNVRLVDRGGETRFWRVGTVATQPGGSTEEYCLDWRISYDTWTAGTC